MGSCLWVFHCDLAEEIYLIQTRRNPCSSCTSSSQPQDAKNTLLLFKLERKITHQRALNCSGNQSECGPYSGTPEVWASSCSGSLWPLHWPCNNVTLHFTTVFLGPHLLSLRLITCKILLKRIIYYINTDYQYIEKWQCDFTFSIINTLPKKSIKIQADSERQWKRYRTVLLYFKCI